MSGPHDRLNQDRLDVVLGAEPELVPSSGFASAVMERVKDAAEGDAVRQAVPAVPFPWKWVGPALALMIAVLVWGVMAIYNGWNPAMPAGTVVACASLLATVFSVLCAALCRQWSMR
jgi:hypothetical protein